MGKTPQVSVIVNCFNGENYLREAIESVYAQTMEDWEIIFWDNASTDDSPKIAQSYDSKIRYYRTQEVVPLGRARNMAIEKADGVFVAFLDSDDLWLPEKLQKQISFFKNLRTGLVYCDALYFNKRGYAREKYGNHVPPQGMVFDAIMFNNFLCMSSVIIRSKIFKQFNVWFDPTFSAIEDTDLFMRISRSWEVAYVPEVLCKYRMHENSISFLSPLLFRQEEEMLIQKCKNIFPEFEKKYEAKCREQLIRDHSIVLWRQGENASAREKIKPLIFRNVKYLLVYIAMYFPYRIPHYLITFISSRATSHY